MIQIFYALNDLLLVVYTIILGSTKYNNNWYLENWKRIWIRAVLFSTKIKNLKLYC